MINKSGNSKEMDGTLQRLAACEDTEGGGGAPITPRGWMGVDFWTMSFYNNKKFISRSL